MESDATLSRGGNGGPIRNLVAESKTKLSLLPGVHEQAEADKDNQQVDICGLIPGFVHRVVYGLGLVPQKPVSTHRQTTTLTKLCE